MAETYILTWNPDERTWTDMAGKIAEIAHCGYYDDDWNCTANMEKGARVFLLRQRKEPRGIVASGIATSDVYEREHWDGSGRQIPYVAVRFDAILDGEAEPILTIGELRENVPIPNRWVPRNSGQAIPPDAANTLETVWKSFLQHRKLRRVAAR